MMDPVERTHPVSQRVGQSMCLRLARFSRVPEGHGREVRFEGDPKHLQFMMTI